jgi:SHS2 domain-containing protein
MALDRADAREWEHFAHDADIGIRGFGADPAAAFAAGAEAMTAVISDPGRVAAAEPVRISCEASTLELLFVDWLNALVYEMQVRKMLFRRFDIKIDGTRLSGTGWGEAIDVARHEPAVEVKGATLTELSVRCRDDGRWVAQCVIDV